MNGCKSNITGATVARVNDREKANSFRKIADENLVDVVVQNVARYLARPID